MIYEEPNIPRVVILQGGGYVTSEKRPFDQRFFSDVVFPLIMMFGALHFGVNGLRDIEFARRLPLEGINGLAVVTKVHTCTSRGVRTNCGVDYAFVADGRTYRRSWYYDDLGAKGQTIPIRYLRSSPWHSNSANQTSATAESSGRLELLGSALCVLVALLAANVTTPLFWKPRVYYTGLAYGVAAYAVWIGVSLAYISRP